MNATEHSTTVSSRHSGGAARLVASLSGGGSGARSLGGAGARTASPKLVGLLVLAISAFLAVSASSASAFETHTFKTSFGTAGSGDGQFELAANSGVAVNETTHSVYLADTNNHRVDVFSEAGTFVRAFGADVGGAGLNVCTTGCVAGTAGTAPGAFEAPTFVAIDNAAGGEGDVYVADTADNLVSKFKADGTLIASWGVGGQLSEGGGEAFTSLRGLAIDSAGNLDLIENEPHLLFRFERGGGFIALAETPRENFAAGLAVNPSGDLFKANGVPSVEKFEASGTDIGQVSGSGSASGLAVDSSNGQLYVDNGPSIDNYTFNGGGEVVEGPSSTCVIEPEVGCRPTGTFGSSNLTSAAGLAVDPASHNVFAADPGAGKIVVFAPLTLPDATTEAATEITRQTATLNGTVGAAGGPEANCAFQYETEAEFQANPSSERFEGAEEEPCDPAGPFTGSSTESVSATLSGLELETTYRFRLVATSEEGSNPGEALGFNTKPPVTLTTGEATAITDSSATLGGEINPEGVLLEECFFEYGETTAYGETVPCAESPDEIGSGNAPVPVHADLEGLSGGVEYHFRLAAKNSFGESKGADATFPTPGPSITEEFATEISATAATLGASINPNGAATSYEFQYVTDAAFQLSGYAEAEGIPADGEAIGSGASPISLFAQIQNLAASTTYHFRVLAESSAGTSTGPDRTFTTQSPSSAALLPDGRQWEQVTPPNKYGSPLEIDNEGGSINQAASQGGLFTADAHGPLGPQAAGDRSPQANQWLSARVPTGWSTTDITAPREELAATPVGSSPEYKQFSADLSRAILRPAAATPLSAWATEPTPYRREADGQFVPLVVGCPAESKPCPPLVAEHANVPPGSDFGEEDTCSTTLASTCGPQFMIATPDLGHLLLSSQKLLTEDFQLGFEPNGRPNLYELSGAKLTLVSVLPDGQPASEAGLSAGVGYNSQIMLGAISDGGDRVVFETKSGSGESALNLRDNATQPQSALDGSGHCTEPAKACTIQLDQSEEEAEGGPGNASFQGASADGSKVFFTDASRLTADSTARPGQPDLYVCQIGHSEGHPTCTLTDLSISLNPGQAAGVAGMVSAIDASGDHVFFAAAGVLTETPNPRGEVAIPGKCSFEVDSTCNLYSYDTTAHQVSLVAVLSQRDAPDWANLSGVDLGELTARSSPDGHWFTFMSQRPLTGYDNRDATSGQPDEEVFLYDSATGRLSCASCNPTGARPLGVFDDANLIPGLLVDHRHVWGQSWLAASIPRGTNRELGIGIYQSRYLSDSGRLFFNSADALVPQDTNGLMDVYQYEPPGVGDCTESSPTFAAASGGCVALISSGTSAEESAFLDASENGADVFFLTAAKLAPTDVDTALDVYDAHACSAESPCPPPSPPPPPACEGDACQPPATPPGFETPGTALLDGPGNLVQCPKGKVKKHGKCVVRHERHKGKKHKHRAKHHRKGTVHP